MSFHLLRQCIHGRIVSMLMMAGIAWDSFRGFTFRFLSLRKHRYKSIESSFKFRNILNTRTLILGSDNHNLDNL